MSDIAIKVENLSKMYRLGDIGTGTLGTDLTSWWAKVRGKDDPNSKIAIANDRSQKATTDYVWSLQNLDFEIKKGDAVGIIGRNGAGKSTLLKILSRVTTPTTGKVHINGRVSSLLEVGTGFHGDLSGRENIYMNGAILGMTRREITSKLEEIIEFSGVAGYIDTPVKRYSSGMYVRLAFAVAAHLDPDIMIVDEVLAVGDAEFQKKCLGKMQDVNSKEGRTVLFVSHNMGAIKNLCKSGIFLQNGTLKSNGSVNDVLTDYVNSASKKTITSKSFEKRKNLALSIESVTLLKNRVHSDNTQYDFLDQVGFELILNCKEIAKNRGVIVHCHDNLEQLFLSFDISVNEGLLQDRKIGIYKLRVYYPAPIFKEGSYSFDFEVGNFGKGMEQLEKNALNIDVAVISKNPRFQSATSNRPGKIYIQPEWEYLMD